MGTSQTDVSKKIEEAKIWHEKFSNKYTDSIEVWMNIENVVGEILNSLESISKKPKILAVTVNSSMNGLSDATPPEMEKAGLVNGKKENKENIDHDRLEIKSIKRKDSDQFLSEPQLKELNPEKIVFDIETSDELCEFPSKLIGNIKVIKPNNENEKSQFLIQIKDNRSGIPTPYPIATCDLKKNDNGKNQLVWTPEKSAVTDSFLQFLIIEFADSTAKKRYLCGINRKPYFKSAKNELKGFDFELGFNKQQKTITSQTISMKYPWPKSLQGRLGDSQFELKDKGMLNVNELCTLKFKIFGESVQVTAEFNEKARLNEISKTVEDWTGIRKNQEELGNAYEELNTILGAVKNYVGDDNNSISLENLQESLKGMYENQKRQKAYDKDKETKLKNWLDSTISLNKRKDWLKIEINKVKDSLQKTIEEIHKNQNENEKIFKEMKVIKILDAWGIDVAEIKVNYSPIELPVEDNK